MKRQFTRIIMCAVIVAMCAAVIPVNQASALTKGKKYLVKKLAIKLYDEDKKKYEPWISYEFEYNDSKDPVTIIEDGDKSHPHKLAWDYSNGKTSMRETYYDDVMDYTYSDGLRMSYFKYHQYDMQEFGYEQYKYKYNKKGDLTTETLLDNDQSYMWKEIIKNTFKYKYYKNGFPKQVTVTNKYREIDYSKTPNKEKAHKKVTSRKYYYNKKGLLTKYALNHLDNGKKVNGERVTFKYTFNKYGLVSKVIITWSTPAYGKARYWKKYMIKYSYTDKTINKKRYTKMINSLNHSPHFLNPYFDYWY
ncbi:MAG: hypothetical protein IIY88_03875 [Eubacterium sp.]|nr:hypothetical protein [Eubacterium sp.]